MITRIVKLSFAPEKIAAFELLFYETQKHIQSFNGCIDVNLFQDAAQPTIFFTVSKWESEADLNAYRNSDFFETVWTKTKALFNDKPQAWTLNPVEKKV